MDNKKKEYDYDYGTLGYCKLVSQDGLKKFISECGASFNIIGRAKEKENPNTNNDPENDPVENGEN